MHQDYVVLNIDIAIDAHELQVGTFPEESSYFGSGFAYVRGARKAGD